MIEEVRRRYLEAFRDQLEAEGYEVVTVEPQLRDSIVKRIAGEEDDTMGFVVVRVPVELRGVEFEGELVVTVFRDRIAGHGVDVHSWDDDPLPEAEQRHLSKLVPPREVEEDGRSGRVWTYYPPPDDLPEGVVEEGRDNLSELISELEAVFERAET